MDQTRISHSQPANATQDQAARQAPLPALATELRSLDDWEMVLVGGGDMVVCW